jgi:murein DD-endopeptidase MepM/ murein hydrolase activator NlpD
VTRVGPAAPSGAASEARLREAVRSLESMLLRQIIDAAGVFKGGEGPGSAVRQDLFANALADAVTRSGGGLGLADEIARSLGATGGAGAGPVAAHPLPSPLPGPASRGGALPATAPIDPAHARLTSAFGSRTDPFTGLPAEHRGVDYGAPEGTPIVAAAPGRVVSAGPRGGYGNAVEIDHGNGLVTLYAHAAELSVAPGETVEAGQRIATVGETGRATGPHLHFEARLGGRAVDPAKVLKVYAERAEAHTEAAPDHRRFP